MCFLLLLIAGASKAGGAERESIEEVLGVMKVPVLKKRHASLALALCDGAMSEAPVRTSVSSSCMEADEMEVSLAAIRELVHTRW